MPRFLTSTRIAVSMAEGRLFYRRCLPAKASRKYGTTAVDRDSDFRRGFTRLSGVSNNAGAIADCVYLVCGALVTVLTVLAAWKLRKTQPEMGAAVFGFLGVMAGLVYVVIAPNP